MFKKLGYIICIPFAALIRLFYNWTGSYGLALIFFSLVVKLIMLPFQLKSKKSMVRMNRMQDQVKEIQKRYANNKEKQNEEMAALYAREGVNPMSGCLWSLLPFPIIIALYNIIRLPMTYFMMLKADVAAAVEELAASLGFSVTAGTSSAYKEIFLARFVNENWASFEGKFDGLLNVNYNFLGIDLATTANSVWNQWKGGGWAVWGLLLLPIISALAQFAMTIYTSKTSGNAEAGGSTKIMLYMMPLMTLWMGYIFPAALCIYWICNTVFSLIQEVVLGKYFNKILDREETDKERAAREKRMAKFEKQRAMMQSQRASGNFESEKKPQPKRASGKPATTENGRVGQRPYARGRAYSEDHYKD